MIAVVYFTHVIMSYAPHVLLSPHSLSHSHEWSAYIRSAEVEHVRRLLSAMYSVDHSTLVDKSQFTIIADELWCRKAHGMP